MPKFDLVGKQFGNLTVVEYLGRKHHSSYWRCSCKCGNTVDCYYGNLIRGTSTSCGCLRSYYFKKRPYYHGESTTRLYKEWTSMKNRCYNKNSKQYHNYGERGIKVCEEWQSYLPFKEWALNNGYSEELSIDRIDVNGDYCPKNCRWITMREQANNRRGNVFIEYDGHRKTATQWGELLGVKSDTIRKRVQCGWPPEECLFGRKGQKKS